MSKKYKSPGVYIEEKNFLSSSIAAVETAIPVFIGYTEKADREGTILINVPTRIRSLEEYVRLFGGAFSPKFKLGPKSTDPKKPDSQLITINGEENAISYKENHELYMYRSMQLFFANGGDRCYIVSVGTYGGEPAGVEVKKEELLVGLEALLTEQKPTIIVVPDAVALNIADCYEVYSEVLKHCAQMQSRIGILDIHNGAGERIIGTAEEGDVIAIFRDKIGIDHLEYGAAYYPWLHTAVVPSDELTFENLDASIKLEGLLPEPNAQVLIREFNETPSEEINETTKQNFHLGLLEVSPNYSNLIEAITEIQNLLPPSAAMAGIYTRVDANRGVWKAPANVGVNSVIKPSSNISHQEQESLNVTMSGKSINAIRTFTGRGTLVWGARTLDGNSNEWRYINVRRTMIMFEQSIKLAVESYVFEPNDANTWVNVKGMIDNFLSVQWREGALAGATPDEAYLVQIGLGSTMTPTDILEGRLRVSVLVALVRPAEFIVISLEQQMQKP